MELRNAKERESLKLSVSVYRDKTTGGYTGFFDAIPEVIAEANGKDELFKKLVENFQTAIEFWEEEKSDDGIKSDDYSSECIDLEFAR